MKTITSEHIQEVLHYADEFPHSGQNRELAEIVRHLLIPSAPLVVVGDNTKQRKGLLWDSQWSNIVNHDHCYENFNKEDAVHHAVKLTEDRIAKNLAGQGVLQATVEPLTDAQINSAAQIIAESFDYPWKEMPKEGKNSMRDIARKVLATPPTSKATRGHTDPIQIIESEDHAGLLIDGVGNYYELANNPKAGSQSTSKADTGSIRNAALEEAAHRWGIAHGFDKHGVSEFIRALKSATPSTIKADHINDAVEMVWHQTEPKERSELEEAWLDREFATGFRSGWNAGVSGNEALLKTMESRITAAIAVIGKHHRAIKAEPTGEQL